MLRKLFNQIFGRGSAEQAEVQHIDADTSKTRYIFVQMENVASDNPSLIIGIAALKAAYEDVKIVACSDQHPGDVDDELSIMKVRGLVDHIYCSNSDTMLLIAEDHEDQISRYDSRDPQHWEHIELNGKPVSLKQIFLIDESLWKCDVVRMAEGQFHHFKLSPHIYKTAQAYLDALDEANAEAVQGVQTWLMQP